MAMRTTSTIKTASKTAGVCSRASDDISLRENWDKVAREAEEVGWEAVGRAALGRPKFAGRLAFAER